MNITIQPGKLHGTITPPPSKSMAHRLLIGAALSGSCVTVQGLAQSQDIQATLACMGAMSACAETADADSIRMHGLGNSIPQTDGLIPRFDCGESGSTLRFLIPIALAVVGGGVFTGRGRLMERPQKPYFDIFDEKGISYKQEDGCLTVRGRLTPGLYRLSGDVSSQFVTGLLYALPLLEGDSEIVLTSPLESRGYVDMTLEVLERFGVQVESLENGFRIPGRQHYRADAVSVEADWSQAAFWYAAAALGSDLNIQGLNAYSTQGDMVIAAHYLHLTQSGDVEIDVSGCPDLVPPLAAMAAVRKGTTHLVNAARLRLKESDRLLTVNQTLSALGARVEEQADSLHICGVDALSGGVTVDCCNDHRIAMMAAVAATACTEPVTLTGAECVAKSYPNFWQDYEALGGIFHVL